RRQILQSDAGSAARESAAKHRRERTQALIRRGNGAAARRAPLHLALPPPLGLGVHGQARGLQAAIGRPHPAQGCEPAVIASQSPLLILLYAPPTPSLPSPSRTLEGEGWGVSASGRRGAKACARNVRSRRHTGGDATAVLGTASTLGNKPSQRRRTKRRRPPMK